MSNHAHLITSVTGVWLLKPEVFTKDRKLGRKGGTRPHPQQHHPVPQGPHS